MITEKLKHLCINFPFKTESKRITATSAYALHVVQTEQIFLNQVFPYVVGISIRERSNNGYTKKLSYLLEVYDPKLGRKVELLGGIASELLQCNDTDMGAAQRFLPIKPFDVRLTPYVNLRIVQPADSTLGANNSQALQIDFACVATPPRTWTQQSTPIVCKQ
jgi:hypothetical protein